MLSLYTYTLHLGCIHTYTPTPLCSPHSNPKDISLTTSCPLQKTKQRKLIRSYSRTRAAYQ